MVNAYEVALIISDALDLIRDRERWSNAETAVDLHGSPVSPHSECAVKWCAMGAVDRVSKGRILLAIIAHNELRKDANKPIDEINDVDGHEAVIDLMKRTRARLFAYSYFQPISLLGGSDHE